MFINFLLLIIAVSKLIAVIDSKTETTISAKAIKPNSLGSNNLAKIQNRYLERLKLVKASHQ